MAQRVEDWTASYYRCVTTHSVTIDLTQDADSPQFGHGTSTSKRGLNCRAIQVLTTGTGTLAVTKLDGAQETITGITDNTFLPIQAKKILPGSNFTSILVFW